MAAADTLVFAVFTLTQYCYLQLSNEQRYIKIVGGRDTGNTTYESIHLNFLCQFTLNTEVIKPFGNHLKCYCRSLIRIRTSFWNKINTYMHHFLKFLLILWNSSKIHENKQVLKYFIDSEIV